MLVSRSTEESHLYMQLHPCECGAPDFDWREHALVQGDGHLISLYSGECGSCGLDRRFEFAVAPEPSPPPPALGGETPSHIIDPGEFLWTSHRFVGTVPPDPTRLAGDELYGAYDALAFAIASIDEVLKFIPPVSDSVPIEAFRSETGQRMHQRAPENFTRSYLEAFRTACHELLVDYEEQLNASTS